VKTYAANPVYAAKYPELATFDQEFYAAVATNTFDENLSVNIKFPLSLINGTPLPSGARGAKELLLGTNNTAITSDPGFIGYSTGNYELQAGLDLFNQMPFFKNHSMSEFGPHDRIAPYWYDESMKASGVTQTGLTLNWSGAYDNKGVTEYRVYKDSVLVGTTTNPTYDVTGLVEGTTYNFKVEAGDVAGNWSTTGPAVSVTTQGPPVFNPLENQFVDEGKTVSFTVYASDPNDDKVDISVANLPEGALFDKVTGLFSWIPGFDKAGEYDVIFTASDGSLTSQKVVKITVKDIPAKVLAEGLKEYLNNMDINKTSKDLLVKELGDVSGSIEKEQYKLALVKLKVFMAEVKIQEPRVISGEQFNYIIGESLDICMAIRADVQNKDASLKDKKIDNVLEFFKNFVEAKDKNDLYNDLIGRIDELIDAIK
jgi:chitodextrinase